MMRRSKLAPHYESYGMHSLLGFEETVSDEAWREANDHARRFKAVADAAAQIDWKHVGATVRSEDQANDLYWNLQDLRDGLLCDAIVETLAGNTKGAASLLRLALQVSEAQSSVPSSSFWPDLSSATRTRNVLMRIASLAQLAPIQFTEAPLCA
jgi:hypothetical protein